MILVKDIEGLNRICLQAGNIAQSIQSNSIVIINDMSKMLGEIQAEMANTTSLAAQARAKVATTQANIEYLSAGLPATATVLAQAEVELETALQNLILMEHRLEFINVLNAEMSRFQDEHAAKLGMYESRFGFSLDSLNRRLDHAYSALKAYLHTETTKGSKEYIRQKSQQYEYAKMLYKQGRASTRDLNNAYRDKLDSQKDGFIASQRADELGVKMSKYNLPEFESKFDTYIDINGLDKSRSEHNKIANRALKEAIAKGELKEVFNDRQLSQIQDGITPDGYTWHHDGNPPPGRIQLVESGIHSAVRHHGGYSLWCERE